MLVVNVSGVGTDIQFLRDYIVEQYNEDYRLLIGRMLQMRYNPDVDPNERQEYLAKSHETLAQVDNGYLFYEGADSQEEDISTLWQMANDVEDSILYAIRDLYRYIYALDNSPSIEKAREAKEYLREQMARDDGVAELYLPVM
jgi:hypothetical protein